MKLEKGVLVYSFLIVILLGVVSANSCSVVSIDLCSSDKMVLQLSSNGNAHAQKWDAVPQYGYVLCCDFAGSRDCATNSKILNLFSATNSHVEIFTSPFYTIPVCYGNNLNCEVADNECPVRSPPKNAILSLSSETNAHVGNPVAYPKKICCTLDPGITCGDGNVGGTEECDDGNINDGDGCSFSLNCKKEFCGDGIITTSNLNGNYIGDSVPEDCEPPTANCIASTCKCEDGFIGKGGVCVEKPSFNPVQCSEIKMNEYDDVDIIDKIEEICNSHIPPQSQIMYVGNTGCEYYPECAWAWNEASTDGVCETKPKEMVNPTAPECKDSNLVGCDWKENPSGSCDGSVEVITITYNIQSTDLAEQLRCAIAPQTIPCPETSMLPFFGFYQFIISLTIISIVYAFMIYRKKIF